MAILIDSLPNLSVSMRRKFKKIFEQLDDSYLIRTPALEEANIAHMVLEGPNTSWLMISYHAIAPSREELHSFILFSERLRGLNYPQIKCLVLTENGESLFDNHNCGVTNVVILERGEFLANGKSLINRYLVKVSDEQHSWIKATLFSEVIIEPSNTIRRDCVYRDNSAQLQTFFLDYDQELAAKLDFFNEQEKPDGQIAVRLINGVAGSGKTLILMSRSVLYSRKYPDRNVLFLSHNRPITLDVYDKIKNSALPNLEVKTFHSFALSQQRKVNGSTTALFDEMDVQPLFKKVFYCESIGYNSLNLSDAQIRSELEYINEYLIENKDAYLAYDRVGRGFALQQNQREVIWSLYTMLVELMPSYKGYLPSLYIKEICVSSELHKKLEKYDHILIDEAQFFAPSWLQLVLKSLDENGQLFMCADPSQGFLKSRLSWKSIGLNVRGRTKRLAYSYRTTLEILSAANALIEGMNEYSDDFVKPDLNRMKHGSKPQVIYSATPQDEEKRFLNELKLCTSNGDIPLQHIMVLCSRRYAAWKLTPKLEDILGKGTVKNYNDRSNNNNKSGVIKGDRIKLMSINTCTGMESGVTFVLGVGDLLNESCNVDLSLEEREVAHEESIRKLYVAMTRAGQKLVLFSTVQLPARIEPFVEAMGSV